MYRPGNENRVECHLGELRSMYTHTRSVRYQGERSELPGVLGTEKGYGTGVRKLSRNVNEGGRASAFASDRTFR